MNDQKDQTEAADGQSHLTEVLEGNKTEHFHFYSFTDEGVRAAIKKALEFMHLPTDGNGISGGNRKIEIETKGINET